MPGEEPCLEYALAERIDHGVWGGCSERERGASSSAAAGGGGRATQVSLRR